MRKRSADPLPSRALGVLLGALVCGGLVACGTGGASESGPAPGRSARPQGPPARDHSEAAQALEDRLAALGGVASVDHTYEKDDDLLPGAVGYDVVMAPEASDAEVLRVVDGAFRVCEDGFGADTATVAVYRGEDEVRLKVSDPDAAPSQVAGMVRFALSSRETGERLLADLTAGDQHSGTGSTLEFLLPAGSDRTDVLPRLNRFDAAAVPAHTDIGVRASDDSALAGFDGLPTARDRRTWKELDGASFASSFTVDLGPVDDAPGADPAALVQVTLRKDHGRSPTGTNRARVAFMTEQLDTLIGSHPVFRYSVILHGKALLRLESSDCEHEGEGWSGEVHRFYADHAADCAD